MCNYVGAVSFNVMLSVVMLSVVMLSVVKLSVSNLKVVAPLSKGQFYKKFTSIIYKWLLKDRVFALVKPFQPSLMFARNEAPFWSSSWPYPQVKAVKALQVQTL